MSKSLHDLIAGTSELRSLPSTTMRLMNLLGDATASADQVLNVIEKDPSLTANLLKLCNSAFYGLRCQVGTARQALVLLGNQTIVNLAFATSMGDVLRGPLTGYHLERNELWHHALGSALAAAHLASLAGDEAIREQAFTAGLVHDIGKLLLNRALKNVVVQLPPNADRKTMLLAEVDILGFDHARAGAALAEAWNFPKDLTAIIGNHHGTGFGAQVANALLDVVIAADLVAAACGFGGGDRVSDQAGLLQTIVELGFAEETVTDLQARLPGDLDAMLAVIGESR